MTPTCVENGRLFSVGIFIRDGQCREPAIVAGMEGKGIRHKGIGTSWSRAAEMPDSPERLMPDLAYPPPRLGTLASMFKLAFSSIGCPDWTLRRVARAAVDSGFEGVELRTFGAGDGRLPSDPAWTDPAKIRNEVFVDDGVDIAALATSCRFDAPLGPPIIGRALDDFEKEVREAKRQLDLAAAIGARFVRVFAFEPAPAERPSKAIDRIAQRLELLCDHARHRGVVVLLENAGGYRRARDIACIIDRVGNPLLGASYSIAVGARAGDTPAEALNALGESLRLVRVQDYRGATPCLPGDGEIPCQEFVERLAGNNADGWVVFEWPKLWAPKLAAPEDVLPVANKTLSGWLYPQPSVKPCAVGASA